jgi:predicted phosphodiesterase
MSLLALISDIHGNAVALDAVLADLTRRGADEVICLGDVAAGGPQPREVIARLRELDCQAIRGNADGWLLDGLPAGRSDERPPKKAADQAVAAMDATRRHRHIA